MKLSNSFVSTTCNISDKRFNFLKREGTLIIYFYHILLFSLFLLSLSAVKVKANSISEEDLLNFLSSTRKNLLFTPSSDSNKMEENEIAVIRDTDISLEKFLSIGCRHCDHLVDSSFYKRNSTTPTDQALRCFAEVFFLDVDNYGPGADALFHISKILEMHFSDFSLAFRNFSFKRGFKITKSFLERYGALSKLT